MTRSTAASKNDHITTREFVLSLTKNNQQKMTQNQRIDDK